MEKGSTKAKNIKQYDKKLNLLVGTDLKGQFRLQTYRVGGRERRINIPSSLLKYPVMKETDIFEIVSLHLIQKQLKIPEYDDMKMLRELFAKPSHVKTSPDIHVTQEANLECSLSGEKLFILQEQYNYIDFLKTLEEKDCFVIIEHIPLDEVKNIEALVTSFGEVVIFRDSLSTNITEKIVLLKMGSASECNWVVSCLHGHAWGEKVLSATKVDDIFDATVSKTMPALKIHNCIEVKAKSNRQLENAELKNNVLPDKQVCQEISNLCDKNDKMLNCESESVVSVPQYLDLPSTCSLSHESIFILNSEFNYVEFLKSLDEKESFVVIEHIPQDANESLEHSVSRFGEITLFHIDMSRDGKGNIALVKMAKSSQCGSVISCLNDCLWGENVLKVRNLKDILSLL